MIVLQPIADAAHLVHGPIACCGNSWEGRGTLSSRGNLHKMGFTTDMSELDIIYGSEEKLYRAVLRCFEAARPKAIFVHATCVSGLIGEDIEAVCKRAEAELGIRVIPVNAPGFVGPKNLGNRIAGDVLLEHVIGTGIPPATGDYDINLIGEYNIAGDLRLVEPMLKRAGISILSRMTGDASLEEITWAHKAKLNLVVCSRALINVAKGMEQKYGIPYTEVSFFGRTEMDKALRAIKKILDKSDKAHTTCFSDNLEEVIAVEGQKLDYRLRQYEHLRGKKAVLYTGGVKSWSLISALHDLGIGIVAVGTKKSSFEDEEKMRELLEPDALLVEDVAPKNLLRLLKEHKADVLVAGGRNQYLAVKEGFPFVDVNQERHHAYAGYDGLVNLAEQISNSIRFYEKQTERKGKNKSDRTYKTYSDKTYPDKSCGDLLINPLKHSPAVGAAMALQGIHRAEPVIHGAQGCNFLGKVLLTRHFREPISMISSKLFSEDVIMGSEECLAKTVGALAEKNRPDMIAIVSTGLTEVKGDDTGSAAREFSLRYPGIKVVSVNAPDYSGGLEQGYASAVEAVVSETAESGDTNRFLLNLLAGPHLTPADVIELKDIAEAFGLKVIVMPDLSALDGSRQGISPLAEGGADIAGMRQMGRAVFTFAIGACMEGAAKILREKFGTEYTVLESVSGLRDTDALMKMLSIISGKEAPGKFTRQRRVLVDTLRDAHFFTAGKTVCIALDEGHAIQTSRWLSETGASVKLAVVPHKTPASALIEAETITAGGLSAVNEGFSLIAANSHAALIAKELGSALYETGFPVFNSIGYCQRVGIGYRGTTQMVIDIANLLTKEEHR